MAALCFLGSLGASACGRASLGGEDDGLWRAAARTALVDLGSTLPAAPLPPGWSRAPLPGDPTRSDVCREPGEPALLALADVPSGSQGARVAVLLSPGGQEGAGLAFVASAGDSYYLARLNTRNNNVRLYRYAVAGAALLAGRDLAVPVGQWHELSVERRGEVVQVALDGEPLLVARVSDWRGRTPSLWVGPGTRACFGPADLAPALAER